MLGNHIFIFGTIFFTLCSQLIIRWQVGEAGELPEALSERLTYILRLLINPWVIASIIATLLAGVSWMLTMSKFEISYAFPWTALNFVFMLLFGVLLFNETLNLQKIIGTFVVIIGLVLIARAT